MRTAAICPTCATFTNAVCVIYDGVYLENIDVTPLDSLETALVNIDTAVGNLTPLHGIVPPTANASFIGQVYIDTAAPAMYYAISTGSGAADWVELANN